MYFIMNNWYLIFNYIMQYKIKVQYIYDIKELLISIILVYIIMVGDNIYK